MAKSKGLATIEDFADECVMTSNRENVLRIRILDGSFAGDVAVDVLLRLLNRSRTETALRRASHQHRHGRHSRMR